MSETQLFAMVVGVWLGAAISQPIPIVVGVVLVVGAFIVQRPMVLIVAAFVLSLGLSARAEAAYRPLSAGSIDSLARLTTDPEPGSFGSTAEAKLASGERVRLSFSLDFNVQALEAGDPIHVTGSVRPVADAPWLRVRHVVGVVTVNELGRRGGSPWWMWPSSVLRSWVTDGAAPFAPDDAALYTGLVIGDDRFQSQAQQVLFRTGGLTHLLAVSGQNVAFALAVVAPLLGRLGVRGRLVATFGVLFVFSIATRFEPSVLRATATAGIAAWAVASGTKASGVRALCLAVTGLLLIDPFLVDSVGFQLSVGASVAILLVAPLILDVLPGPRFVAEPLAVTVAAQVGVAPIMLATFGPVSLSTIPANLLAGPAAGVVMTWGLSIGIVSSWLPLVVAGVVQWPAGLLVKWIGGVASWAARWPLPTIGSRLGIGLVCAGLVWWLLRAHTGAAVRAAQFVVAGVSIMALLVAVPAPPSGPTDYGSMVYFPATERGEVSVLVVTGSPRLDALEALVGDRVRGVDVVVTTTGGYSARLFINELAGAVVAGSILGPPLHQIRGVSAVDGVVELPVAGGVIVVESGEDRMRLEVSFRPD